MPPRLRCGPARAGPPPSFPTNAAPSFPIREKFQNFCLGSAGLARIRLLQAERAGIGRAASLFVPSRPSARQFHAPDRAFRGRMLYVFLAEPNTRPAGLSNAITLDTKAFRSRVWARPHAPAIAPKSSSR